MAKLALVLGLILAVVIASDARRAQQIGMIPRGSTVYYRQHVSRSGPITLPRQSDFEQLIDAVVITYETGSERARAVVVGGGLNKRSITLDFKAPPNVQVDAIVELFATL